MNIKFKKVIMKNFLSYGEAELELTDKGYCLVSGINYDKRDNSLSNGAGKSTWSSAICWALTGETIQGIKSNIKNKNIDEKECWVKLYFDVDSNKYEITRYNEPKSDLKIIIDGVDRSGKGIRESEAVLASYLPDLTSSLIASIIILGQGLPCKFSSNTPSGRKDVLEKLSKSDFMIQDIKNRLSSRLNVLNDKLRKIEDELLRSTTKKESKEAELLQLQNKLSKLQEITDYDVKIEALNKLIAQQEELERQREKRISDKNAELGDISIKLNECITEKDKELNADNQEYQEFFSEYLRRKGDFNSEIKTLQTRINEVNNIKDVCPTCGRPFEGIVKPSVEAEQARIVAINAELTRLNETYNSATTEHNKAINEINAKYKARIDGYTAETATIKQDIAKIHAEKTFDLGVLRGELATLMANKANQVNNIRETQESIDSVNSTLKILSSEILYNTTEKQTTSEHISVLNQMGTLIKRDFRGFLLSNVINFIDNKAKQYAQDIFGTSDLNFELDGNNIDISYLGKAFESLSGGEKQRVDLIIQFAIRDMMSQYLNFSSNILVLDEIFDQLDNQSSTAVINLISNKLNDIESIFIISHHAYELSIPSDSELVVIKDERGISRIK